MPAIALSNNDVVFLAWQVEAKIADCLGFAVYRMPKGGTEEALPAWVGFKGDSNPDWKAKTTETWPIQKFTWRDLTAKSGETYVYRIVPMVGTPGDLKPLSDRVMTTEAVTVTPDRGDCFAYFNRGILSTQFLARQLPHDPSGAPSFTALKGRIDQPGDPLRNQLSGGLRVAMLALFDRVEREGGALYAALYELNDPELEHRLLSSKGFVHLILSNTGVDDRENHPARQALHAAGVDITDRMVPNGHIGHNKFVVLVDEHQHPKAVWTGSTNWTDTGLCAQSNNGLLIESPELAGLYLDYWNRLKADEAQQSAAFRKANDQAHDVKGAKGGSDVTAWFSPNTTQKTKSKDAAAPGDLNEVFEAMAGAKEAILFLVFQPGSPSVVDQAAEAQNKRPDLFVHGAATDPKAVDDFDTHLFHRSGSVDATDVVAAAALKDQIGSWEQELLKSSPSAHAIIHDKIVVIDPFSPECTVITGSHNLGYRASYNNDENLLIIRGNRALAEAYATHVMDVYDHYRWRYLLQQHGSKAWMGLAPSDDWQDKYFQADGAAARELAFWMHAAGEPAHA
jgi:phosphatidylserine/phosphatidylglycerophosphate/cardiolipin synthase-like enzyme